MSEPLFAIAYISRNCIKMRNDVFHAQIAEILDTARRNNANNGVTGALLFSADCFAQVLEGPLAKVETVFERIQMDDRHDDVRMLFHRPIEKRAFGAWTMAFGGYDAPADIAELLVDALNAPEQVDADETGREVVATLQMLMRRQAALLPA